MPRATDPSGAAHCAASGAPAAEPRRRGAPLARGAWGFAGRRAAGCGGGGAGRLLARPRARAPSAAARGGLRGGVPQATAEGTGAALRAGAAV